MELRQRVDQHGWYHSLDQRPELLASAWFDLRPYVWRFRMKSSFGWSVRQVVLHSWGDRA